jgi:hypothetical protein
MKRHQWKPMLIVNEATVTTYVITYSCQGN